MRDICTTWYFPFCMSEYFHANINGVCTYETDYRQGTRTLKKKLYMVIYKTSKKYICKAYYVNQAYI